MRKTKVAKQVCILLVMVLMFSILNVHPMAMSTPLSNDATQYLEERPELAEAGIVQDLPQVSYANRTLANSVSVPWEENVFYSHMYEWEYLILAESGAAFHVCSDGYVWVTSTERPICGSILRPTSEEFVVADIANINEPLPIPSASIWENTEMPTEIWSETIWLTPEEEEYYKTHGRLRNLSDYLSNAEYWIFRASGMTLEEFFLSGMVLTRSRTFDESADTGGIQQEQFDIFYDLGLWQNMYEAVRELGLDLTEYEAMLAKSGKTLSELVTSLMMSGSRLADIEAFLQSGLTQELEFYSVSFEWDGVAMPYDEQHEYSYGVFPASNNVPIYVPIITFNSISNITHNSVRISGRIDQPSDGFRVTHHGLRLRRNDWVPHFILWPTAPSSFTHTITGLVPSSGHSVNGLAGNGSIPWYQWRTSGWGSFTTLSGPQPGMPTPPRNLQVNTSTPGRAILTWQPPLSDGGSRIFDYFVRTDVCRQNVRLIGGYTTSHVFDLPQGGYRTFRVTVQTAAHAVSASTTAMVTPLGGNQNVTLTFNGNGGSPISTALQRTPGTTMGAMPANPTRLNHTFVGWFTTQANTGGMQFTSSSDVPSSNTTYWARWSVIPVVTFNYTSAGHTAGSPPASHSANVPGNITLRWHNMTRAGYTFGGWRRAGGGIYQPDTVFNFTNAGVVHFEAVWNPILITVTFDPNGGPGSPIVWTRRLGEPLGTLPTPTRPGETFAGWYTTSNPAYGLRVRETTLVPNTITRSVTYFAQWMIWHDILEDKVAFWPGDINVYTQIVGPVDNDFDFMLWSDVARVTWSMALGMHINSTPHASNAQIRMFGGTREHLYAIETARPEEPYYVGWAVLQHEPSTVENFVISGRTRSIYRMLSARGYVIQMSTEPLWTQTENIRGYMLMVTMHELGHTLGFLGHAPNRADIMTGTDVHNNTTLQRNEVRHLRQIYVRHNSHFR